jgi:D-sedoheptulose 7-phosphate isomerase
MRDAEGFSEETVRAVADDAARVIASLADQAPDILRIVHEVRTALADGATLYTCGNGGSAAEALHLAEELIGRYKRDRPPYRAVCLNADATALTCIANDFGYDAVFARQAQALVKPGDVLVGFSTSGNSPNVLRALEAARAGGGRTVGLLGKTGGACAAACDVPLVIASDATERIQEAHQVVIHLILEAVESAG